MNKKFKIIFLLVIALGVGTLLGIHAYKNHKEAKEAELRDEKVVIATGFYPDTFDPGKSNMIATNGILLNLYEGLFRITADGKGVEKGICKSYELSEDGTHYTFHIKENMLWSNGDRLTAKDFEYAWLRVLSPEFDSSNAWELFELKNGESYHTGKCDASQVGVKAVSDYVLEVDLEKAIPYFENTLTSVEWMPIDSQYVEKHKEDWADNPTLMPVNGPFRIDVADGASHLQLRKNYNYNDRDSVKSEVIEIRYDLTAEEAFQEYKAGKIDGVYGTDLTSDIAVKYEGDGEMHSYNVIGCIYYDFNCSKDYLSAGVRRALSTAISRDEINATCFPAHPNSAYGFVPYGIVCGTDSEQFRDYAGAKTFEEDFDQAKVELAAAGYAGGKGLPTLVMITDKESGYEAAAYMMKETWAKMGVNVEVQVFEEEEYWERYYSGDYDICYDGWTSSYSDPHGMLEVFNPTKVQGESRWSGAKAEEYFKLLDEEEKETDNARRMELCKQMEQIIAEEMPVMPLYYRNVITIQKAYVEGMVIAFDSTPLFKTVRIVKK